VVPIEECTQTVEILMFSFITKGDDLVDTVFFTHFLKDHLTDPEPVSTKYMGFCSLPRTRVCRRIDMRCIKYSSLPSALLYFTGNGEFNKNMRSFALKKGFTINEYGIYKLNADKTKGAEVAIASETDIFKTLGLEYIEPKDRLSTVKFK
jgi:DNA polymerase beta